MIDRERAQQVRSVCGAGVQLAPVFPRLRAALEIARRPQMTAKETCGPKYTDLSMLYKIFSLHEFNVLHVTLRSQDYV